MILAQPMVIIDDIGTSTNTQHLELFTSSHRYEIGDRIIVTSNAISKFAVQMEVIATSMNRMTCILRDCMKDMIGAALQLPKNRRWYDFYRTHKPYRYTITEFTDIKSVKRMNLGFSEHQRRQNKRKAFINSLKSVDT